MRTEITGEWAATAIVAESLDKWSTPIKPLSYGFEAWWIALRLHACMVTIGDLLATPALMDHVGDVGVGLRDQAKAVFEKWVEK